MAAVIFIRLLGLALLSAALASAETRHYEFVVEAANFTRLCNHTKAMLTVNGEYPGPTIHARKNDVVVVKVHNRGYKNITIHWHGVDQPRNPWTDGPDYITQCPLQPGTSFTYNITLTEEVGTVWWHAHSDYDRATVHGALVIRPDSYPFPRPHRQVPIILGEWYNADVDQLLAGALSSGGGVPNSDANTINGQPGDLQPCSSNDTFKLSVKSGKTYLLQLVNAAMDNMFFFTVAGHRLTVVGTDGSYVKPFATDYILIAPGQTMDVLLTANAANGRYYMAARPYTDNPGLGLDSSIATGIVAYMNSSSSTPPEFPTSTLPAISNTTAAMAYIAQLRSLNDAGHPVSVPRDVGEQMLITISVNAVPCPLGQTCRGPFGDIIAAALNNASFAAPSISVLQAYYNNISGVYTPDFPDKPPLFFDFTAPSQPMQLVFTKKATRVKVLEFNTSMEIVLQDTSLLGAESHPIHLHGHSFYVVGYGAGNFNASKDSAGYNLVDPPYQNTVIVPGGGWAAIRFRAANPGVWFMHCHFDRHLAWGMDTVFIVKNGDGAGAQMLPPPADMPPC